ncbi:MAG: hypothetical protein SVM80_13685 [Halobacteriota archaeon]|nr:hypothetical protein [Halobacteriota archaeon]
MTMWLIDTEAKTIGIVRVVENEDKEEEDGEKTTEKETEHLQIAE